MKSTTILAAAFLLVLLSVPRPTAAQAPDAEDPDRWRAEVGFTLNSSGGNKELTVLTSEVSLTHLETATYEANIGGRFRYGRTDGEKLAQNLQGTANFDLWPAGHFSPFLFATAENDPFKKLEARLNGGAGVKHTFWQRDWDEVSLSGAVLYSYENLQVADSLGTGVSHTARWSWRGRGRTELGQGRRFEQQVLFHPDWDRLDDYLLEARTTARWAINSHLAFTTTFLYERDNTPAPDVEPDDWSFAVGLTVATRW